MKKMLSILICTCMILALLPAVASPASAANASAKFKDVDQKAWYVPYIDYVVEKSLMAGTSNTSFGPDNDVTRAQYVQVLYALAGKPTGAKSAGFTDVESGKWYTDAVNWAASIGVTGGMTKTTFAPDAAVTREQAATFFKANTEKVLKQNASENADIGSFPDAGSVSNYAKTPMAWAVGAGLISGVKSNGKNYLSPQGKLTRAQLATMMKAYDMKYKGKTDLVIDQKSDTVSIIKQNLSGSYTLLSSDSVESVEVTLKNEETDTSSTEKAVVSGTKWQLNELRLYPGKNTITVTLKTKQGESVSKTITLVYDEGEFVEYEKSELSKLSQDDKSYYVNDVLLVLLDPSLSEQERANAIQAVCKSVDGQLVGQDNNSVCYQVKVKKSTADELEKMADSVDDLKGVRDCFVDYVTPVEIEAASPAIYNDPWDDNYKKWGNQDWSDETVDGVNWWAEAINLQYAWNYKNKIQNPIKIGVCDAGFMKDHEDLKIEVISKTNNDYVSHGTHVAGIIGATPNNGKGAAGILGEKSIIEGYGTYTYSEDGTIHCFTSTINKGIGDLIARGNKVINKSLGGIKEASESDKEYFKELIENWSDNITNEFIVVQSAGNDHKDAKNNDDFCCVDDDESLDHIIVVAAADYPEAVSFPEKFHYKLATYSNYGSAVTIAAPGGKDVEEVDEQEKYKLIYSTLNPSEEIERGYFSVEKGKYGYYSGTSMAAPMVTGVAGFVWGVNPELSSAEVKDIIVQSATKPVDPNEYDHTGTKYYLLDAKAAVEKALEKNTKEDNKGSKNDNTKPQINNSAVTSYLTSDSMSVALLEDGSLWYWGGKKLNAADGYLVPTKIMDNIAAFDCDHGKIFALKRDGTLWIRGNGKTEKPQIVCDSVKSMDIDDDSIFALLTKDGKLVLGKYDAITELKIAMENVESVKSCGAGLFIVVTKDGRLVSIKASSGSSPNNPSISDYMITEKDEELPNVSRIYGTNVKVAYLSTSDGSIWAIENPGTAYSKKKKIISNVKRLDCVRYMEAGGDGYLYYAYKNDGTYWRWSENTSNPMGVEEISNSVSRMSSNLSDWDTVETIYDSINHCWYYPKNDSSVYDSNSNKKMDATGKLLDYKTIKIISESCNSAGIVKTDGTLWTYGDGKYGALGLGNTNSVEKATKVIFDNNNVG